MVGTPATITIARTSAADIGIRDVLIYLDGQMIATLRNKQTLTREILPGPHTLRAHNTFAGKTIAFDVRPGDQLRFTTANRSGCATALIFVIGAGPIYIFFERDDEPAPAEPAPQA